MCVKSSTLFFGTGVKHQELHMGAVSEGALQCPSDAMDWNFQIYHFPLEQMYVLADAQIHMFQRMDKKKTQVSMCAGFVTSDHFLQCIDHP